MSEPTSAPPTDVRDPRRVYEAELHPLPREERLALARTADGTTLAALCLDPEAAIVGAVLDNPQATLVHARLVALHHRTAPGLEALTRRAALLRDAEVQRALLRNPQATEIVLQRLLQGLPIARLFPLVTSREVSERARRSVREAFRRAFQTAEGEERVRVIVATEGRCLAVLAGIPLGQKAAALLGSMPIHSTMLVQALATWSATPTNVLAHLLRQPVVQRAPHLRQAVLRHPNCPSTLRGG